MLPVLLLLALVLIGAVIGIVSGASGGPARARAVQPAATPSPAAVGQPAAVVRSLAAVERAFNAGDLPQLCRRRGLVDPAVISLQAAGGSGCEAELEALKANASTGHGSLSSTRLPRRFPSRSRCSCPKPLGGVAMATASREQRRPQSS